MSEDHDPTRQTPIQKYWSATLSIIAINVVVFLIQLKWGGLGSEPTDSESRFNDLFALSLDGIRSGHIWQLVTYQFMHASWFHLAVNSWAIFVFGRILESIAGKGRMLQIYFLSGIAGGLLQTLWTLILPAQYNIPVVGASAGASGLVAAFAVLLPSEPLLLLLFFVIPLKLKARTLLQLSCGFALLGMGLILFKSKLMDDVAHAGHLGGLIGGYIYARMLIRRYGPPRVIEKPIPSLKTAPVSN